MDTQLFLPLAEQAIRERRNIEIDYESPDGRERHKRIVSPFDVGSTNPNLAQNFKDNLYAFSPDHTNKETGEPEPQVLVFSIPKVHSARLLDETFDPEQLRTISLQHDNVDWGDRDFNLVSDRAWFVPAEMRSR